MPTTRAQQIARVVREARREQGLTQRDLAKACGVHVQTIGNLERALHEASPELLAEIGRVLTIGLSPAALAAAESVDNIKELLTVRLRELSDADRLTLASDTLHFVAMWEARSQRLAGVTHIDDVG